MALLQRLMLVVVIATCLRSLEEAQAASATPEEGTDDGEDDELADEQDEEDFDDDEEEKDETELEVDVREDKSKRGRPRCQYIRIYTMQPNCRISAVHLPKKTTVASPVPYTKSNVILIFLHRKSFKITRRAQMTANFAKATTITQNSYRCSHIRQW